MAKKKPVIKIRSYGIHSKWDVKSKELPKIKEFTTDIPAQIDIEFGLIINIQNARGNKIYCLLVEVKTQGKVFDSLKPLRFLPII